jgi:hypothetical protein
MSAILKKLQGLIEHKSAELEAQGMERGEAMMELVEADPEIAR